MSFSIGIPVIAYQLQESMAEPSKFERTVESTFTVLYFIFVLIGVFGNLLFAHSVEGVQPIIISNLPKNSTPSSIVKVVVSLMLLFSIPLSLVPALNLLDSVIGIQSNMPSLIRPRNTSTTTIHNNLQKGVTANHIDLAETNVDEYGPHDPFRFRRENSAANYGATKTYFEGNNWTEGSDTESELERPAREDSFGGLDHRVESTEDKCQHYGIRLCVLAVITLIAIGVPCFTMIMSLLGCLTIGTLSFILPPLFYIRLSQLKHLAASSSSIYLCYAFVTFGCMAIIMGTIVIISQGKCQ